ncbi:basic proline-rich protein-like [Falco rusticolus]|uniref:basic proline-rich protein-like n=1 Tax=Falco rusticolus TaxID=120794 RepID=UPI00188677CC|nr:basic proline-rich protein-like [Falco rusticolus]
MRGERSGSPAEPEGNSRGSAYRAQSPPPRADSPASRLPKRRPPPGSASRRDPAGSPFPQPPGPGREPRPVPQPGPGGKPRPPPHPPASLRTDHRARPPPKPFECAGPAPIGSCGARADWLLRGPRRLAPAGPASEGAAPNATAAGASAVPSRLLRRAPPAAPLPAAGRAPRPSRAKRFLPAREADGQDTRRRRPPPECQAGPGSTPRLQRSPPAPLRSAGLARVSSTPSCIHHQKYRPVSY